MLFEHSGCRAVCTNPKCSAHGRSDSLVKNGRQSNGEQRYKCITCSSTCNYWSGTLLSKVHRKHDFVRFARAISRGSCIVDIASTLCLRKDTVIAWLLKLGNHCNMFLGKALHDVKTRFLQMDEIQTWIGRKSEKCWIWQAIDANSKLWLGSLVSPMRDHRSCNHFITRVVKSLDRDLVMLVTTDGLSAYKHPVRRWFKSASYAQVVKEYEGKRLIRVDKRVMTGEPLEAIEQLVQRLSGGKTVNTAFTERLNATIRRLVGRLARRTLAFSRSLKCLEASINVAQVAYNFVMRHRSLGTTPAQAAGLCDSQLSWLDIICSRS